MREFICLLFGMISGGGITAAVAWYHWQYSETKRITEERIAKLEQDTEDRDARIRELERDLSFRQGGDDF